MTGAPVASLPGRILRPVLRGLVHGVLGGFDLRAAERAARRHLARGRAVALGYWNGPGESPRRVLDAYLGTLRALRALPGPSYLSVKLPAFGSDDACLDALLRAADAQGIGVHADSLGPETADPVLAAMEGRARDGRGVTLPGRWRRSVDDAARLFATPLAVRVVKGEWGDPEPGGPDPRAGFLAVVDALAGRGGRVSVATHDAPLAADALDRLRAAHTPCDLEVLANVPARRARSAAQRRGLTVRVYVPFGRPVLDAAVEFALARRRHLPAWLLDL